LLCVCLCQYYEYIKFNNTSLTANPELLTKVDISQCNLDPIDHQFAIFLPRIRDFQNLATLNISHNNLLRNVGTEAIVGAAAHCCLLSSLDISECGFNILPASLFVLLSRLTALSFVCSALGFPSHSVQLLGITGLTKVLPTYDVCDFQNCRLNYDDTPALIANISYVSRLASLDLSGLLLSSESFDILLSSVDVFRSECFTSLRARSCGLAGDLAVSTLMSLRNLECLDLSENDFGPSWTSMFLCSAANLSSLSTLSIIKVTQPLKMPSGSSPKMSNDFAGTAASHSMTTLNHKNLWLPHDFACNLTYLNISKNDIHVDFFHKMMVASSNLTSLCASYCKLDESAFSDFLCTNLKCLDLSFNRLSQRAVSAFVHILPGLSKLNVSHCFLESLLEIPLVFSPCIEHLWLDHAVFRLPEASLNQLFIDCPNLATLSLRCTNITKFPQSVGLLTKMTDLFLQGCSRLVSLHLAFSDLDNLRNGCIQVDDCCQELVFPPFLTVKRGARSTIDFLKQVQKESTFLKRVKVLFLGNGRSGKTSLLRALVGQPLRQDEPSTVGVDIVEDGTCSSEELQAGFFRKLFRSSPHLSFWDFAGQLEYSAAHDYFMSSRQAVYVLVFSATESAESRLQQLSYWLSTVFARANLDAIRILIVCTQIDLLDSELLERQKIEITASVEALLRKSWTRECTQWPTLEFATSNESHSAWKTCRRRLKEQILAMSESIFEQNELKTRFPKDYEEMIPKVIALRNVLVSLGLPPCCNLKDSCSQDIFGKNVHLGKQLDAFRVLGDVGVLIYYESEGNSMICCDPQYLARVIALFCDPLAPQFYSHSQNIICNFLIEKQNISQCETMETCDILFKFLVAVNLVMPLSALDPLNSLVQNAPLFCDANFCVPLSFKGRPCSWQEVYACSQPCFVRGYRLRTKSDLKTISVAKFASRIQSLCNGLQSKLFGSSCFLSERDISYFIRVAESRTSVDIIIIRSGSTGADFDDLYVGISDEKCASLCSKLSLSFSHESSELICPFCCISDMYVRSGAAHCFYPQEIEHAVGLDANVTCSRGHKLNSRSIRRGVLFDFQSKGENPLSSFGWNQLENLDWASFHSSGINIPRATHRQSPGFKPGQSLISSYFVLTRQLALDQLISTTDLLHVGECALAGDFYCKLRDNSEDRALSIRTRDGDFFDNTPVQHILSISGSKKCRTQLSPPSKRVQCMFDAHQFQQNDRVLIHCFVSPEAKHHSFATVLSVVSEVELELELDVEFPISFSTGDFDGVIMPRLNDFGVNDQVLLIFSDHLKLNSVDAANAMPNALQGPFINHTITPFLEATWQKEPDESIHDILFADDVDAYYRAHFRQENHDGVIRSKRRETMQLRLKFHPDNDMLCLNNGVPDRKRIRFIFQTMQFLIISARKSSGCQFIQMKSTIPHGCSGNGLIRFNLGHAEQYTVCTESILEATWPLTSVLPLTGCCLTACIELPYLDPFQKNVLVVFDPSLTMRKPSFRIFQGGKFNDFEMCRMLPEDCVDNSGLSSIWSKIEDHWSVMFGQQQQHYEISEIVLFQNSHREQLFRSEVSSLLERIGSRAAHEFCSPDDELKKRRQNAVLKRFEEFKKKFVLKFEDHDDANVCVCWWGNKMGEDLYQTLACYGFWELPFFCKLDYGYYGSGIYSTKFPRYSDYYISGCSFSTNRTSDSVLMCVAALGQPYPVTENPFDRRESLLGRSCGDRCGGTGTHDSHYVVVKQDRNGKFLPCPDRQEPEYDEIVVFKPERILPTASVNYCRRRKTLLWLDDDPNSDSNVRVRLNIPGCQGSVIADSDHIFISCVEDSSHALMVRQLKFEDQTDVHLFLNVRALVEFLSDPKNFKFSKYPESLFRIITNRRLFIGQVNVFSCCEQFFKCSSTSLLSVGDSIQFTGELFGNVEAQKLYFVKEILNGKQFSIRTDAALDAPAVPLSFTNQREFATMMKIDVAPNSFQNWIDNDRHWAFKYPCTLMFHGGNLEKTQHLINRPWFVMTEHEQRCKDFTSFYSFDALR